MSVCVVVFLILLAVWITAGRSFATRPVIAKSLGRWGHILLQSVAGTVGWASSVAAQADSRRSPSWAGVPGSAL